MQIYFETVQKRATVPKIFVRNRSLVELLPRMSENPEVAGDALEESKIRTGEVAFAECNPVWINGKYRKGYFIIMVVPDRDMCAVRYMLPEGSGVTYKVWS